jgi:hypothetical protein
MYCVRSLGAFAKFRKATVSHVLSVCPSVRMEEFGSHWTYFREIFKTFQISVEMTQVSLKFDKNNWSM